MFAARGIAVVIGAEHHASLLPVIGGGFLSLDIWVASDDAEEASALLRDLGDDGDASGTTTTELDPADAHGAPATSPTADPAGDSDDELADHARLRGERHRPALALLVGVCITFGTAHMISGAWLRGVVLAAIEVAGILRVTSEQPLGNTLILAAITIDVVGALWRLRAARADRLPAARVRRGG
jgi:hypothetical protein